MLAEDLLVLIHRVLLVCTWLMYSSSWHTVPRLKYRDLDRDVGITRCGHAAGAGSVLIDVQT